MLYLDGDYMTFLDEKEVFLTFYEDVKEDLGELKCAWSDKKVNDSDVIIFNARDRSEEKVRCYMYERNDGEDDCAEARYICDVSVLRRDGGSCPVESNIPADEPLWKSKQLQEIIKDYEERGFQVPNERLSVPIISCLDGTYREQLIVVVSVLDSYGEDDEEENDEEYEEEVEESV